MKVLRLQVKIGFILLMSLTWQLQGLSRPVISFFCELENQALQTLLAKPGIEGLLKDMQAELRLGVREFSEEQAAAVQKLNDMNIPVYIWIQANEENGGAFHVKNAASLLKRYQSFKNWSMQHDLKWEGIGIDLRPDPEALKDWVDRPLISSWNSYLNLFKQEEYELANRLFSEFREVVKKDGHKLESYVLPYAIDEILGGGQGYQYMGQTVNLAGDKIIPLCYTSFSYISPASVLEYGKRAQNVAIGSVNSSMMAGKLPNQVLTWEQLSRDLRLAHDVCKEIHISNLESVVANGWLEALAEFDFSIPVYLYSTELAEQENRSYLNQKPFKPFLIRS